MKKYQIIYADPPSDELRECIKQGYCWWCKTNGWKRLAQHTAMAHNIYADDIRKMAIMLKRAPTCIQEESEIMSDRRLQLMKEGKVKIPDWRLGILVKHEYSEAGLKSLRDKMPIMRATLTDEVKKKATQKAIEKTSKPHHCPICGKIIPCARPVCCSVECRRIRQNTGVISAVTRKRLGNENPEYKLKMSQMPQHQKYKKSHNCITCGKSIPRSRPRKYCSPECASNPFHLPIGKIKEMYLNGISSVELSRIYHCCDHTIRRHLKKVGIEIKGNEVESDIEL